MTILLKSIRRELAGFIFGRKYIVTLEPGDIITFREKSKRTHYWVSLHKVYLLALLQFMIEDYKAKKERALTRKAAGLRYRMPKPVSGAAFDRFTVQIMNKQNKNNKISINN